MLSEVLARVIAWRSGDVAIDLADVQYIDATSVRVLTGCQQMLDRERRTLSFRSPSRLAARVLRVFGLSEFIDTRERAQR